MGVSEVERWCNGVEQRVDQAEEGGGISGAGLHQILYSLLGLAATHSPTPEFQAGKACMLKESICATYIV